MIGGESSILLLSILAVWWDLKKSLADKVSQSECRERHGGGKVITRKSGSAIIGIFALFLLAGAALAEGLPAAVIGIPLNAGTITALVYALLALAWAVIRLTPTDADDRIMEFVEKIIRLILPGILPAIIPDKKKLGPPS